MRFLYTLSTTNGCKLTGPEGKVKIICSAIVLLACISALAQTKNSQKSPCNDQMSFCWYGDEVEAWGSRWVPQDASEKPLETSTEVRCLKKLGICADANSRTVAGKLFTKVEILRITRWNRQQITADGENSMSNPCERDSYVINRVDNSVLLIVSPGPESATEACKNILGKPRTIVYKLSD
jgi:hypothetical protein